MRNNLQLKGNTPKLLLQGSADGIFSFPLDVALEEISGILSVHILLLVSEDLRSEGINCEVHLLQTILMEFVLESPKFTNYISVYKEGFQIQPKIYKVHQCVNCLGFRHNTVICQKQNKCDLCTSSFHRQPCTNRRKYVTMDPVII